MQRQFYRALLEHVLTDESEGFGFLFVRKAGDDLEVVDQVLIPRDEAHADSYSMEWDLSDEVRSRIFKQAKSLDAKLVEVHSHPFSKHDVGFSGIDTDGLAEFVPHVWWRLGGGPYGALVMGKNCYDALVWVENAETPQALESIVLDDETRIYPTNRTLKWLKAPRRTDED